MAHREIDRVEIDQLEGRVTSVLLTPDPPGIPLLIPGERFNATIVRYRGLGLELVPGSGLLAAVVPDVLNAGVPFYGTPAAKEVRKNIKAPLLIQLAELDTRVNESWPGYEADLKAAGVNFTMHLYPKCNHGFHNDSTGRYDEKNAQLAWERTIAFFKQHLA
jgi:acetyl esterase/lipase